MTDITLDDVKAMELEMLLAFRDFCAAHHLSFYLVGGTLLGAVRHKGFIPWDDDIDIGIPRPDYERLLNLRSDIAKETPYSLSGHYNYLPQDSPFCKLVHESVYVQEKILKGKTNLWIDIFPIDAFPDNEKESRRLCGKTKMLRFLLACHYDEPKGMNTKGKALVAKIIGPVLRRLRMGDALVKKLNAASSKLSYQDSNYAGIISWGLNGIGERIPTKGYTNPSKLVFEKYEFCCNSHWDQYLSCSYGDYMTFPPIDKRESHIIAAWTEL